MFRMHTLFLSSEYMYPEDGFTYRFVEEYTNSILRVELP
jgi:hypothetical protein